MGGASCECVLLLLSLSLSLVEPKDFAVSTATFRVQRSRGTFTDVSVEWEVVSGGVADIQPIRGVVNFIEGQSSATFEISALPDNVSYRVVQFRIVILRCTIMLVFK